jgi:chromosome segregation ATPase
MILTPERLDEFERLEKLAQQKCEGERCRNLNRNSLEVGLTYCVPCVAKADLPYALRHSAADLIAAARRDAETQRLLPECKHFPSSKLLVERDQLRAENHRLEYELAKHVCLLDKAYKKSDLLSEEIAGLRRALAEAEEETSKLRDKYSVRDEGLVAERDSLQANCGDMAQQLADVESVQDDLCDALAVCAEELEESIENEGRLASFAAAIEKARAALDKAKGRAP